MAAQLGAAADFGPPPVTIYFALPARAETAELGTLAVSRDIHMSNPERNRDSFPVPGARFTFFHLLWFSAAAMSGIMAFAAAPAGHLVVRVLIGIAFTAVGFVVFLFVVLWLVGMLVVPRTRPGTYWHYEADCYMRSVLGRKWVNAGEIPKDS